MILLHSITFVNGSKGDRVPCRKRFKSIESVNRYRAKVEKDNPGYSVLFTTGQGSLRLPGRR